MAKMVKPTFDWVAKDKLLTELEQFKADCNILFSGSLCDLKEKQQAGLLVNWLDRETTPHKFLILWTPKLTTVVKYSKH